MPAFTSNTAGSVADWNRPGLVSRNRPSTVVCPALPEAEVRCRPFGETTSLYRV
ncbi:hypothetical protein SAMN04489841_3915 [Natrinema salaciae]|uniref:Uncharacterized protein n=1 Tax=Natrinema salaciae TaxID=1186196 RepID=A0A1H9PMI2_9EURY|nr:hypothetical protein SAMN04489841_3915 [Natrinema salaciae]